MPRLPVHNHTHAHKQLLHQGVHLVEHPVPHHLHGFGTLIAVLIVVHVVGLGFIAWLLTRPPPPPRRRKRVLGEARCEEGLRRAA